MTHFPIQLPRQIRITSNAIYWLIGIVLFTNIITFILLKSERKPASASASVIQTTAETKNNFYLIDQAQTFVMDVEKFERSVKQIANNLNVPPEWLMAVIYSESKFDASATNKNSGATGLIQWKPSEINQLGITVEKLRNLSHEEQLKLVEKYYKWVKKNKKPLENLTEFYLGAFYPDAIGEEYCYAIYKQNEVGYKQYQPLDANKDGQITVKEIDERLKRLFPTAYMIERTEPKGFWAWLGW